MLLWGICHWPTRTMEFTGFCCPELDPGVSNLRCYLHGGSQMGHASGNLSRACVVSRSFLQLFSWHFFSSIMWEAFFFANHFPIALLKRTTVIVTHIFHVCHFLNLGIPILKILRMIFKPCSMRCWVVVHHLVPTNLIFKLWMVPLDEFVEDSPLRTMPTPISPCASPTQRSSVSSFAVTILDVKVRKFEMRLWGNDL